jgi:hypothetical protein
MHPLQPLDQFAGASDGGRSQVGVPGGEVGVDRSQDPAGPPQGLIDLGPTDIGQEILPWPDPRAGIIVAEMSVAVAAHRPAGSLEGHQQVLDMGDVLALRHERRQRRMTRDGRTGRISQAADRLDDVVAERLDDDLEEGWGRVREQICGFRTAVELEVGVPLEIEGGNILA